MPDACVALQKINLGALVGASLTYELARNVKKDGVTMTMCRALDDDRSQRVGLLLREQGGKAQDSEKQRVGMIESLGAAMGGTGTFEKIDLGEAALWNPAVKQLTVWFRGGRVMMILDSGLRTADLDLLKRVGKAIVYTFAK